MVEPCGCAAECECDMQYDESSNDSASDAEELGRGCREGKEKQYVLKDRMLRTLLQQPKRM